MLEPLLYERQSEGSLRDVLFVLFRHKRKIALFFGTVFCVVALATFLTPEMYQSNSKLMVRLGRESVTLDPTASTGQTVTVNQDRKQEINSELEILRSRELAEKVVDAIGVDAFLKHPDDVKLSLAGMARDSSFLAGKAGKPMTVDHVRSRAKNGNSDHMKKRDLAITGLMKKLDIQASKESNVISISYEARSPEMARAVVTRLIDVYLEKHVDVYYSSGSYDFFTQQAKSLHDNLTTIEEDLRNVRNSTGIASLGEQRTLALNRMGLLQQEIERNDAALASSKAKIAALELSLKRIPGTIEVEKTTGIGDFGLDNMRAQKYSLELREKELLSKYTEESQQVRDIRKQIADAQEVLDREQPALTQTKSAINESYRQAELSLETERASFESLRANGAALRKLLADVSEEVREINNNELQITALEREKNIQESNYRKYSDNLEQARIDQAMQMEKISNIKVVQAATNPLKPVRPKKMLNLTLGLVLGLLGGIGFAFSSEYVDHTFKRPEDIEKRLQLPLLATIADFSVRQKTLPPVTRRMIAPPLK